jgi:hypothetical protein
MASELIVQTLKGPTSGANANKILLGSGQELYAPGHVIQVVQGEHSSEQDTSSTSYVSTGLTATITPSSTSSKVLILVMLASSGPWENNAAGANAGYRIFDGTSSIIETGHRMNDYGSSGIFSFTNHAINYLHSPSTTLAITYRVDHKLIEGDNSRVFNSGAKGTITLMEIAG